MFWLARLLLVIGLHIVPIQAVAASPTYRPVADWPGAAIDHAELRRRFWRPDDLLQIRRAERVGQPTVRALHGVAVLQTGGLECWGDCAGTLPPGFTLIDGADRIARHERTDLADSRLLCWRRGIDDVAAVRGWALPRMGAVVDLLRQEDQTWTVLSSPTATVDWLTKRKHDGKEEQTAVLTRVRGWPPEVLWSVPLSIAGRRCRLSAAGNGRVALADNRLRLIGEDGQVQAVSLPEVPRCRSIALFGDCAVQTYRRHTTTGREPLATPVLVAYDWPRQQEIGRFFDLPAERLGDDDLRLVSDVRFGFAGAVFATDGDILVHMQPCTSRSLLQRHPCDVEHKLTGQPVLDFSVRGRWPFNVLLRLDLYSRSVEGWTCWAGLEEKSSLFIEHMAELADGSIAIVGKVSRNMLETGNAFPVAADRGASSYVAVFSADFSRLRFASRLPGTAMRYIGKRSHWRVHSSLVDGRLRVAFAGSIDVAIEPPPLWPPGSGMNDAGNSAAGAYLLVLDAVP